MFGKQFLGLLEERKEGIDDDVDNSPGKKVQLYLRMYKIKTNKQYVVMNVGFTL